MVRTEPSPIAGPGAVKRSVSLAIRSPGDAALLLVRRPAADPDLPGAWGLPAATLAPGESWEHAAVRAARDKLGVAVELGAELARGALDRTGYRLEMRLFDGTITDGAPEVPQRVSGVTQYSGWRWGRAAELRPAAAQGSLCCRLMLEAERRRSEPAP